MKEIWKPVNIKKGIYSKFYKVSNLGKVKSMDRYITQKNGVLRRCKSTVLKPRDNENGYLQVTLCMNGIRSSEYIHRIVAEAFIPNLNNLPCIDHLNGIKYDNRKINLEWCTYSENNSRSVKSGLSPTRGKKPNSKSVINCRGDIFNNITDAAEQFGLYRDGNISSVCKGRRKSAGKYEDGTTIKWKYYEQTD